MSRIQLTENAERSYKIGMDEIRGLEVEMRRVLAPVVEALNERDSWSGDDWFKMEKAEYKSRDGFISYPSNCGGIMVRTVVPKCGESDFPWLDFGECDDEECIAEHDHSCSYEGEGHLDAGFRLWFKFEGLEDGRLNFYLVLAGGNGDAPYFRTKYESTYFEASFECGSVGGVQRAASKHIKALVALIEGKGA